MSSLRPAEGRIDRRSVIGCLVSLGWGGAACGEAAAADEPVHDHAAHMAAAQKTQTRTQRVSYLLPAVTLLDQQGRRQRLDKALDDGRPVILNFIFTTCTTICPVMTQILTQVQTRLSDELDRLHMVSISIDPEQDTPPRLLSYAQAHGCGAQWDFYTGSREDSVAVQRAFNAYRGDKMNHLPLTLLRGPHGDGWLRLEGFASADAIVQAYREVAA